MQVFTTEQLKCSKMLNTDDEVAKNKTGYKVTPVKRGLEQALYIAE